METKIKTANPYMKTEVTKDATTTTVQNPYINMSATNQPVQDSLLAAFDTKNFLVGATIGALGAYILTNENAQKAIFKTIAGGSQMFQAGIEELKERYEDAKAELEASRQ